MIRRTMLLPALMVLVVWVTEAQSRPPVPQIHRIHVGVMGSGSEADRFHKLLENELRNGGFEISEAVSGSEGDMDGEFSYETHGDFSSAHANFAPEITRWQANPMVRRLYLAAQRNYIG